MFVSSSRIFSLFLVFSVVLNGLAFCSAMKAVTIPVVDVYSEDSVRGRSFFRPGLHIDVAGNGEVFICCQNESLVKRYDAGGRLIAEFGKQGQGPGDLLSPHCIQVTENQVFIADRSANRKVSVFSREGGLVRVISTLHNVNQIACLSEEHLAYISIVYEYDRASGGWIETHTVHVMDLKNSHEIEVCSKQLKSTRISIRLSKKMLTLVLPGRPFGDVLIAATPEGTLLVGRSTSEMITEYDVEGHKRASFPHGLPSKAIPKELIRFYRDSLAVPRGDESVQKEFKKALEHSVVLDKHLPFYHSMIVDSSNRLYLLSNTGALNQRTQPCHVYDSMRKSMWVLNLVAAGGMSFDFAWWGKSDRIRFHKDQAFSLVSLKDGDDEYTRLVKVKL